VRGLAHIAFADALSGTKFGWIIVQKNFRMGKHHQQRFFLGERQGFALIQQVVATAVFKQVVKGRSQCIRLGWTGMVSIGQQISVELPEVFGELFQEVAMGKEAWRQFRGTWRYS
jgi:hypothetical protein